jgi:hypothetical protein
MRGEHLDVFGFVRTSGLGAERERGSWESATRERDEQRQTAPDPWM